MATKPLQVLPNIALRAIKDFGRENDLQALARCFPSLTMLQLYEIMQGRATLCETGEPNTFLVINIKSKEPVK